uniref:Protein WEAK CHLOROPLAST MOVEMENT UNDER BLUE LIGHT 1-like n=1 Tax=Leersia perrieri TaxID=77586 RepID=A0A0D9VUV8_9ORYZ
MEVLDSNGHGIAKESASAPVENPDSSFETQKSLSSNLSENMEKTPTDHIVSSSPDMLSQLKSDQESDDSLKHKTDLPTSTSTIEANNISENGLTDQSTVPSDESKSKQNKMNPDENIAATTNKKAETEARPESPCRGLVDTAAPFESVREAVTKFGGIVDWKAYRSQTLERRRVMQLELEKAQQEIPQFKQDSEAAEMAKLQVIEELERTRRLVEELKHKLERAEIDVDQAKQDSELAQLRAQELEQGIDDEASVIAQTQLAVAKERHQKAVEELKLVKEDMRSTHERHAVLATEKDIAAKKAEEAVSAAKETEKRVEELTLELIAIKESLELAHTAHHEAEEHRLGAALAKEQDCLAWEKELQKAQEELQQLNMQLVSKTEVQSKLDENMLKLHKISTELAAHTENKLSEEAGVAEDGSDEAKEISRSIKRALTSIRNELEGVRGNIEKTKDETNLIKAIAESLRSELDKEKASLVTLQQREGMASITVSSLEAELNKTKEDIEMVHMKEAETREKMVELPKMLQQAAQEAEDTKDAAHSAQEELKKAKEEAEQTKAAAVTAEIRLRAVLKEIEASKASEKLALVAAQALQESEETSRVEDSPRTVTLPISEYHSLSKRVYEAEELANERIAAALAQIELAKESETRSLERLQEAFKEMSQKKVALEIALERAERAKEGKLGAEQELRKWRAELEQRRKAAKHVSNPWSPAPIKLPEQKGSYQEDDAVLTEPKSTMSNNGIDDFVTDQKLRKKKSFLPQMSNLLSRKAQT